MATTNTKKPSPEELVRRKKLEIGPETVSNQASTDFPGHWPGENHDWDLDAFRENLKVEFHEFKDQDREITFSLIGLDTSLANAFRRLLIAEVPTLAIEDVFIFQNTSIIQDEVLAHRLGLIPLCGDREALHNMKWYQKPSEEDDGAEVAAKTDYNCAAMELRAKCTWKEGGLEKATKGISDPNELYENHSIYARDLVWKPTGKQHDWFPAHDPIRAAYPDILIAKMRPGQEIDMQMHAIKGIGQDHAKFSPVATASYRLLPTIDILRPIIGADAKKFARCFPKDVINLEKVTSEDAQKDSELGGKEGETKAVVGNTYLDTVSRECLRHPEFKDKVKLGRIRDHFIFRVESTGQQNSDELFLESVKLLKIKAQRIQRGLAAYRTQ